MAKENVVVGPTIAGVKFPPNVKVYPDRDPQKTRVIIGVVTND